MPTKSKIESTGEIVKVDGQEIVVRRADPQALSTFFSGDLAKRDEEDNGTVLRRMADQILTAETAEEIFGSGSVIHARDYLDRPFTILSVDWNQSSFVDEANAAGMPPMFMVLHIVDVNKQAQALTTGAGFPMLSVYQAQLKGVLSDVRVKFLKKDRPTQKGYYPLNLVLAD